MEITIQKILKESFEDRKRGDPQYSLRAFARDLSIAPSSLSEILAFKKGLSAKKAYDLSKALQLPDWQASLFCNLAAKMHSKSDKERKAAELNLAEFKQSTHLKLIESAALFSMTSWIDLAILESTNLKKFQPSHQWVAKLLSISTAEVKASVKRLIEARLLKIESKGKWVDLSQSFTTSDGIPNESIKNFHCSVLLLAAAKVRDQSVEARTVKSVVFSLKADRLAAAKKIMDEAITKIVNLADDSVGSTDDVYCFSSQLFSLTNSGDMK